MTDWRAARRNMVDCQVRTSGVTDRGVIAALQDVPRERFVPASSRELAYCDEEVALQPGGDAGAARYLVAPMIFARLVQLADIGDDDVVLDIGCATGYSSAVIARLAGSVVALEEDGDFAESAQSTLTEIGIDNVAVVRGELAGGYPSQAPYDAIVLQGAVEEVPQVLFDQLGEGGRLVVVIVKSGIGRAHLFVKDGGHVSGRPVFDAAIPQLPGFSSAPGFVFAGA